MLPRKPPLMQFWHYAVALKTGTPAGGMAPPEPNEPMDPTAAGALGGVLPAGGRLTGGMAGGLLASADLAGGLLASADLAGGLLASADLAGGLLASADLAGGLLASAVFFVEVAHAYSSAAGLLRHSGGCAICKLLRA